MMCEAGVVISQLSTPENDEGSSLFQQPLVFLVVRLPQDPDHVTSAGDPAMARCYHESSKQAWRHFLLVKTGDGHPYMCVRWCFMGWFL